MPEPTMASPYASLGGGLALGGISLERLAAEYGTPLYVYHRPTIAARLAAVQDAFKAHPTHICYSVKANANLRLLKWLAGQGVGFDVVSGGELARTATIGAPPGTVVFAGVGKTPPELAAGVAAGIWMVNVEAVEEADALAACARTAGRAAVPISLRLNPDVDAGTHPHITTGRGADKFGIALTEYGPLLDWLTARPELALVGLHMHLGSQITDPAPYAAGMDVLLEAAAAARARGFVIRWINAGGGFGIAYGPPGQAPVPGPEAYAAALLPRLRDTGFELLLELGRYLVGPAGCLVTRVLYRKQRDGRPLVIVDAGMTDLLRPALYGAHHRIVAVDAADQVQPTDVAGPICESSDFLGRERLLPPLAPGALLAVLDAGAYGMAMASHYNSHPRVAEVWITETGEVEVIRRRETVADMLAVEIESL
ncbi:MAG: diaminopimelate decarboxylase [Gemmatimonadota bacterium]